MIGWIRGFGPAAQRTGSSELLRAGLGAAIGIALTGLVASLGAGLAVDGLPLLIAPMGASAVLLFVVPASPLAQPWSILCGNFVSAAVGVAAARAIPDPLAAAALAIAGAIVAMGLLRCVHPPSGAVALTAVLGGVPIHAQGFAFLFVPVMLDSILLVAAAILFNRLTGRSYPHRSHPPVHPHPPAVAPVLTDEDFDSVLADYGEALDIGTDDLKALYTELRGRAEQRLGERTQVRP